MNDISITLKVKDGDFDLLESKESLYQDESIILNSSKGNIINNILLGVGVIKYLHGPIDIVKLKLDVNQEFKKDNITVTNIKIANQQIYVDSFRK